jgi:hypothetical protein
MAGHLYMDGGWVSQGDVALVNEEWTEDPTSSAAAGAVRQFVAGQLGKTISLTDPTNAGDLIPKTYQYVQRHPDSSADLAPGTLMYWVAPCSGRYSVIEGGADAPQDDDPAPLGPAGELLIPAGIFLGDDAAALGFRGVQPGNFGFIQIGGCADAFVVDGEAPVSAGSEAMDSAFGATSRGVANKTDPAAPRIGVLLETVTEPGPGTARILLDLVSLTVSQ